MKRTIERGGSYGERIHCVVHLRREYRSTVTRTPLQTISNMPQTNSNSGIPSQQQLIQVRTNLLTSKPGTPAYYLPSTSPMSNQRIEWAMWDKAFPTPNFHLRVFANEEKLQGHRNYKNWRKTVELELTALNLLAFTKEEMATSIPLSPSRRAMLDAQALQYVKASVSRSVLGHIQYSFSAFTAMSALDSFRIGSNDRPGGIA